MALESDALRDEDYNSASDHDFNPDAPNPDGEEDDSSSKDSDEEPATKAKKRKNTREDLDFDNSGDEATILKAKRKKQRTALKDGDDDDEDGGEGGLVKTRAQRKAEIMDKKPLTQAGNASVNVDDLWAQMSRPANPTKTHSPIVLQKPSPQSTPATERDAVSKGLETASNPSAKPQNDAFDDSSSNQQDQPPALPNSNEEATVTIKRIYEFAGQKMEEERVVPATSAEARLYIEEKSGKSDSGRETCAPSVRRPKKRTSMFHDASVGSGNAISGQPAKGPKLNTLEKSKLDWAAHVDHEGMSGELDEHRRAKEGYLGRMDFLGRMDAKREEELRNIKPK